MGHRDLRSVRTGIKKCFRKTLTLTSKQQPIVFFVVNFDIAVGAFSGEANHPATHGALILAEAFQAWVHMQIDMGPVI